MASSSNDGDAPKSSNQNSYNNKIFNQSQKNIKSRSHKANPNEKATMETTNGNSSKGLSDKSKTAQAQEKNCGSTSLEEGEL
jgi:hypothetical protein